MAEAFFINDEPLDSSDDEEVDMNILPFSLTATYLLMMLYLLPIE